VRVRGEGGHRHCRRDSSGRPSQNAARRRGRGHGTHRETGIIKPRGTLPGVDRMRAGRDIRENASERAGVDTTGIPQVGSQNATGRRRHSICRRIKIHLLRMDWSGVDRERLGRDICGSRLGRAGGGGGIDTVDEIPRVGRAKTQPGGAGAVSA
jgi:hypothetical protein